MEDREDTSQHTNHDKVYAISGTNNALKGTPLAACLVPKTAEKAFQIYLYYVDNDTPANLNHVIFCGPKASGSWGKPSVLDDAPQILPASGLAAIADPMATSPQNHVFALGDVGYIDVPDYYDQQKH